jgi:hypothetical protein
MRDRAGQQLLRERRALIRRIGLAADQRHAALVAGAAQSLGGASARMAGADDHDMRL